MVASYLLEVRGCLLDLIGEYFTLVDHMGEGILVLNDMDSSIEFSN